MSPVVLYEDRHCLVVNKPSRLLTASDKTGDDTLINQVRAYNASKQEEGKKGYVAPLHFLDRPVSGVVMFAVSSKAASRLSEQMRAHKIEKVYLAVVEGRPPQESGELVDWLLKDHEANIVTPVAPGTKDAKPCKLDYRLLGRKGDLCLLEIRPRTGRSHQIRVQLASRGMPIYGDRKYGSRFSFPEEAQRGAIALHARAVTFTHPVNREPLTVSAPLPDYFREILPVHV